MDLDVKARAKLRGELQYSASGRVSRKESRHHMDIEPETSHGPPVTGHLSPGSLGIAARLQVGRGGGCAQPRRGSLVRSQSSLKGAIIAHTYHSLQEPNVGFRSQPQRLILSRSRIFLGLGLRV